MTFSTIALKEKIRICPKCGSKTQTYFGRYCIHCDTLFDKDMDLVRKEIYTYVETKQLA